MNAATTSSPRWPRRLGGLALYSLIWALPTASFALLIGKVSGFTIGSSPAGTAVFAIAFILTAAALHALLGRRFPRLLPVSNAARVCLDDALSTAEKVERLQQDAQVWRSLLANTALLSLLVIAALAVM